MGNNHDPLGWRREPTWLHDSLSAYYSRSLTPPAPKRDWTKIGAYRPDLGGR